MLKARLPQQLCVMLCQRTVVQGLPANIFVKNWVKWFEYLPILRNEILNGAFCENYRDAKIIQA